MAIKKITLSEVFKQDLEVVMYLAVYGGVTLLSKKYLVDGDWALVFGAIADYIVYRVRTELQKSGYREALKN